MTTITDRTWAQGDTVTAYSRYRTQYSTAIKPGLFAYSGFGMGTYYGVGGEVVWTDCTGAVLRAKEQGVEFCRFDPF